MQAVIQGFVSQSVQMADPLEKVRRFKRSLDNYISFRKAFFLAIFTLAFMLYIGPSIFSWLFGSRARSNSIDLDGSKNCINSKLSAFTDDLSKNNAHSLHEPWRISDHNYLPYVGNGYFGLATELDAKFNIPGAKWTLNVPVNYKPVVSVSSELYSSRDGEFATVVHYTRGFVQMVNCYNPDLETYSPSVSRRIYAHRKIPGVLVQEIKISNPSGSDESFRLERLGIAEWSSAKSRVITIEEGEGGQKYIVVSGIVPFVANGQEDALENEDLSKVRVVSIVAKKLPSSSVVVKARMTETIILLTSITYSEPINEQGDHDRIKSVTEQTAINSIVKATGMSNQNLRESHETVWRDHLWTTGFGISYSHAENAINGHQINATIYYVLSQVPATIHALDTSPKMREELAEKLVYSEGCYGATATLLARNLWSSLTTVEEVNRIVKLWRLTLEKNGCHNLVKAGADGVSQAMVLSFLGLSFRQQHLELNAHPKDLHRDYYIRRVSYGAATHVNISIVVQEDNRATMFVALDRRNKDYFACDAGCLDDPVKLTTQLRRFPVKLTDPATAILYITSDYRHMKELKDAIHVYEIVDAPAHEHHVIALHKHGNKLGGLPTIFWFSISFLILVFHAFLIKLIWQEYCAGQDKFRTR